MPSQASNLPARLVPLGDCAALNIALRLEESKSAGRGAAREVTGVLWLNQEGDMFSISKLMKTASDCLQKAVEPTGTGT